MKRALAERAKQQTDEQHRAVSAVSVPSNSNSNSGINVNGNVTGMPPKKIPRTAATTSSSSSHRPKIKLKAPSSSSSSSLPAITKTITKAKPKINTKLNAKPVTKVRTIRSIPTPQKSKSPLPKSKSPQPLPQSTPSSSSTTKSKKRIRPPAPTPPPAEPDDSDQSAFYLKHQNKALASELHQYKFMIHLLERERLKRRQECREIGKSVRELEGVWRGVERVIVDSLGEVVKDLSSSAAGSSNSLVHDKLPQDVPASTGSGQNVEVTMGIMESITSLANSPHDIFGNDNEEAEEHANMDMDHDHDEGNHGDDNGDEEMERESQRELAYLDQLSKSATNFSNRCSKFQQYLLKLIKHTSSTNGVDGTGTGASASAAGYSKKEMVQVANFERQIANLQSTCSALELQVKELGKARDDANNSERRVRRGLYRVASGRLKIGEVLQAVEKDGSSSLQDLEQIQNDILSAKSASASTPSSQTVKKEEQSETNGHAMGGTADAIILDGKVVNSNDVIAMKKEIDDLQLVNESRDNRISELTDEKLNQDKQINNLMAQDKQEGGLQEKDILVSPLFVEISNKLTNTEKEVKGLQNELQSVRDRWASSKGDLELAQKAIEDLEKKHNARLRELSGGEGIDNATGETINGDKTHIEQAKLVMELEHKLKHALDTVRQSESVRMSLADAHSMNDILQRQIGELKAKNEEFASAEKEESNDLLEVSTGTTKDGAQSKDKLYRMKKELTAALESKNEFKYKCEHVEKQRQSLVTMNMRLQQQSVEKDDMNAKSLSSILHLKQLSEQLEQEKNILEKNLKSAQQLALAARLAAFAKARVEHEAKREKAALEEQIHQMQASSDLLQKEKGETETQLAVARTKVECSKSDMSDLQKRCDELVAALVENEKERRRLEEALVVAKKDAIDAAQKAAAAQAQARGPGSKFETAFTAEELTIQVKELKNRLTCPVCNTRDKKVIITRCRHMFCRNCVDASLQGRNRKCPSCGLRFDKKDVEDVWF